MRLRSFGKCAWLGTILTACGTQADWGAEPCSYTPPGTSITPPTASISVGDSLTFVATQWNYGAGCALTPVPGVSFVWTVSDTIIARAIVTDPGVIVGISPGQLVVTARASFGGPVTTAALTILPRL
jgi:uncharacterized protein YjdB